MLRDVVCNKCQKLLLKLVHGSGEIKCKCGQICKFNVISQRALVEEIYNPLTA